MSILDWLSIGSAGGSKGAGEAAAGSRASTIREIVDALDSLEEDRARYIASYAYILGRVAHADLDISNDETGEMERLVVEYGHIPEEQAVVVVQMAKTHNQLFGGTENYLVTREFDRQASQEEKMALLKCLFAVSASDESISSVEDSEIRKIAEELHLTRDDFLSARSMYRDHLEILKKRVE